MHCTEVMSIHLATGSEVVPNLIYSVSKAFCDASGYAIT